MEKHWAFEAFKFYSSLTTDRSKLQCSTGLTLSFNDGESALRSAYLVHGRPHSKQAQSKNSIYDILCSLFQLMFANMLIIERKSEVIESCFSGKGPELCSGHGTEMSEID